MVGGGLSRRRLVAFYGVALALPLLALVALELGLRYADYGGSLALFIAAPAEMADEPHWVTNPKVAQRYFPRQGYSPRPRFEAFLQQKPDNGYRVFVLGGSTAASWPYPANVSFSRMLRQRLADTFPDREIEVVNTAISAINSFTLVDFIDEVLAHEPDAILIYAGHNEFYGALGAASSQSVGQSRWLIRVYLALLRLKTVQLIRDGVNGLVARLAPSGETSHATLMGRMVGQEAIAFGSDTYETAKANYRANLREILAAAQAAGVPVLLSELVSNLRDHPPFVPLKDETGRSAADYFTQGRRFDQAQQYGQARVAYLQARALDGLRFRAPDEFNEVIHAVAAEFGAPVVPMVEQFEQASPQGIIGSTLMLEHLHPNVEGYFLMSEAFYRAMWRQRLVETDWSRAQRWLLADYRQRWPVTELDRALGRIRIINLTDHWPYPPKEEGERTIETFVPDGEADALAYQNFREQISYREAHQRMAHYYEGRGDRQRAFREYRALVAASPHIVDHYLLAVGKLLEWQALEPALALLYRSREIKETGYANKWIGQIYLTQQQALRALPFLQRAQAFQPDDAQLLYSLGVAYGLSGQRQAASETLAHLYALEADSPRVEKLERLISQGEGR